ncbi:MAG: PstS family phosphate ABC transporter substrate-binding protein [Campylobacteraceae bacterium]|nr:PstS family phosphate ABC transporter substrate-binding protein [Campylobacteraceae bacterium]
MRYILLCVSIVVLAIAGEMKYVGSSTIGGTILPHLAKDFSIKSGIVFKKIEIPGSGKGIAALLADKTRLAGISRNIKDKERAKGLRFFIIAYDAIGVIVNKNNPIKNLSEEQLKKIFSGEIINWNEVGGADLPIKTITEKLGEKRATQIVFTELIFETKKLIGTYGPNNIEVDKPVDEAIFVGQNQGAIAATSMVFFKGNTDVHSISINGVEPTEKNIADGSYPISRPLEFVTKKDVDEGTLKFLNYAYSKDAQEYINKTFVAVKVKR